MHGVMRVRTSEEEALKKKKEREIEITEFKANTKEIFQNRALKVCNEEVLMKISEVLCRNPDIATLWNYRREILLQMVKNTEATNEKSEISKYFNNELRLTESCLKVNPKSYGSWHHRMWIMQIRTDPDWDKELKLCNYCLKLDERNLHCWNYRDFVIEHSNISLSEEIDYSLKKIEENFSNYSAWHYRSKLLTTLHSDWKELNIIPEEVHSNELELVINAAFTDPNDSSAWFYQKWLLGPSNTKISIAACRVTLLKTIIAFNKSINLLTSKSDLILTINDSIVNGVWKSAFSYEYDIIWILEHEKEIGLNNNKNCNVILKYNHEVEDKIECFINENDYIGYGPINFENNFSPSVIRVLKNQHEMCQQLLEFEPDSKWTLLTYAVLKYAIDRKENYMQCKEILKKLEVLDPKRKNYYKDLFAKWHIEYCLENDLDSVKRGKFCTNHQSPEKIDLHNLFHAQHWSVCEHIDLRNNNILECNLPKLVVLQSCKILDLGNNKLRSLKGFPILPELEILYIDGNDLDIEEIKIIECCPKIKEIYLSSVHDDMHKICPTIKFIENNSS